MAGSINRLLDRASSHNLRRQAGRSATQLAFQFYSHEISDPSNALRIENLFAVGLRRGTCVRSSGFFHSRRRGLPT
jgi:hypothetical protein